MPVNVFMVAPGRSAFVGGLILFSFLPPQCTFSAVGHVLLRETETQHDVTRILEFFREDNCSHHPSHAFQQVVGQASGIYVSILNGLTICGFLLYFFFFFFFSSFFLTHLLILSFLIFLCRISPLSCRCPCPCACRPSFG
ncbi:hypothetical protein CMEL01_05799 [Colletotrichum melonis]|uniref:Uncharacterized protein n=1 Tax=Colletotrichum melonis TaxID=1209925 RepID=A0AAI9XN80_9PEZI|nr:hypothetical protein CMEL01_05799 [Colletotrichum melonis]